MHKTLGLRYSLVVEYLYAQDLGFDLPPQHSVAFIYLSYSITDKNSGVRYWGENLIDQRSGGGETS